MENFNVANFKSEEPILTSVYPEKINEPENSLIYGHLAHHGMGEVDVPLYQQDVGCRCREGCSCGGSEGCRCRNGCRCGLRQRTVRAPSAESGPSLIPSPSLESEESEPEPFIHTFISLIHTILAIFALYLSFICNKGFDLPSFIGAACCPYIYILYVFAIRPDLCGFRA
jgi:hypothetical protein